MVSFSETASSLANKLIYPYLTDERLNDSNQRKIAVISSKRKKMPSEEEEIKRRKEERRRRNKELRTFRSFKKYSVKRFKSLCKLWLNDSCPKTAEECDLVHAEAVVKKPQLCRLYFCSKLDSEK